MKMKVMCDCLTVLSKIVALRRANHWFNAKTNKSIKTTQKQADAFGDKRLEPGHQSFLQQVLETTFFIQEIHYTPLFIERLILGLNLNIQKVLESFLKVSLSCVVYEVRLLTELFFTVSSNKKTTLLMLKITSLSILVRCPVRH